MHHRFEFIQKRRSLLRLFWFAAALIAFGGCTLPQEPGKLEWDINIAVPFGVRTYGIWDMVDPDSVLRAEGSGVSMNDDSSVYFTAWAEFSVGIRDCLYVNPVNFSVVSDIDTSFSTNQSNEISSASIASGSVTVQFFNASENQQTAILIFPDIVNHLNDSLVIERELLGNDSDSVTVNLTGLQIHAPMLTTLLRVRFISDLGNVLADITTTRWTFDYFSGNLNDFELPIPPTGKTIERPREGWETVQPISVQTYLHSESGFGGTADLSVHVATLLNESEIAQTDLVFTSVDMTGDTSIYGGDVAELIEEYPDSVGVAGSLVLNGNVATYDNSEMNFAVELRAPLMVTFDSISPPGTVERIDNDDLNDIQDGTATIRIWNRLPVNGHAFLVISRDSSAVLDTSTADIDTLVFGDIPAPTIIDGRAVSESYVEYEFDLSDSLLSYFREPPFFARMDVFIPGIEGDTLIVYGGDYLKVQIFADLVHRIRTGDIP